MLAVALLMTVQCWRRAASGMLRAAFGKWSLLRAIFITVTFLAFYGAIPFLSLSTVGAANYMAPIFVTLLSAFAITERVGRLGWLGVGVGFTGVVVLLRPGTDAFSPWVLLPIMGAAFYALAHITTRVKCQNVPVAVLSLSQNIVMLLAGAGVSLMVFWSRPHGGVVQNHPYIFGQWSQVSLTDWVVLGVLAGFAVAIGMILAGAYQAAPPTIMATCEYSYLAFATVWDIVIFGTAPTVASVHGMILIVGAGLLVLRSKIE